MNIPKQFIPAIEKGFLLACEKSNNFRSGFVRLCLSRCI